MAGARWPAASWDGWSATCDTLHGHTQLLGKLAALLAPPEPRFQHVALRLTVRGWETAPLPAPNGSGTFGVALDLHAHEALVEHADGRLRSVALTPHRSVGEVTRRVLEEVAELAGPVEIDPTPEEVPWSVPLDEDTEHATYEPEQVAAYFAAATRAARVLATLRAPHERSTPVSAWWGSFDIAVSLFSSEGQEVAVGWWPGDPRYPKAAFYAYARPAPDGFAAAAAEITPDAARWNSELGEYILDWDDVRAGDDPHAYALKFARSAWELATRR